MRILYIDIDTLRADHLGCYGYHRNTSPNIDAIARQGVRFDNVYITDAPCLPSRSALWSGRPGYVTGVVGHGGTAAEPIHQGAGRGFRDIFAVTSWMSALSAAGVHTVSVSPFADRHGTWQWYAGYKEIYNPGKCGSEFADDVTPLALDWIQRNAKQDNWFLHVNYWDPHTPYRTPAGFGDPFASDPLPAWMTEEVRQRCWDGFGPHSAREPHGYPHETNLEKMMRQYPRLPASLNSMDSLKQWIDGYDTGIRYADTHTGMLLDALEKAGVLEDTVIMISTDHGESQGELNVWGDHQTADQPVCRIPLIVRCPGLPGGRIDCALHQHYDWTATLVELAGGKIPANWLARPFTGDFRRGEQDGRQYLITSNQAWSCQRGIRFDYDDSAYLCLRTYHDGHKDLPPLLLFNLTDDPYEQNDLSQAQPEVVNQAMAYLADWQHQMALATPSNTDPMLTVLREGGPFHTRGRLPQYLQELRATGRAHHANNLERAHPDEV